jgi:antitoxin ParD1/3/4
MATNTSISLDDHFTDFLAREVAGGRYRSASEVVRAGLRLLEDQETQMSALRAALVTGEESGPATPFDFDQFIASKKA